jgi:hypothetical protein
MLRELGWRVRPRNRADCRLCSGRSTGTVSFRERVWHCHRCHAGGSVYDLVMAARGCSFREALSLVAGIAGVPLQRDVPAAEAKRQLQAQRQWRERTRRAAEGLAAAEKQLWLKCRDRIHQCDRVLAGAGPWTERLWQRAQAALVLQRDFLLPAHTVLSFGAVAERTRFVMAGRAGRAEICASILSAGGVRTEDGFWKGVMP